MCDVKHNIISYRDRISISIPRITVLMERLKTEQVAALLLSWLSFIPLSHLLFTPLCQLLGLHHPRGHGLLSPDASVPHSLLTPSRGLPAPQHSITILRDFLQSLHLAKITPFLFIHLSFIFLHIQTQCLSPSAFHCS